VSANPGPLIDDCPCCGEQCVCVFDEWHVYCNSAPCDALTYLFKWNPADHLGRTEAYIYQMNAPDDKPRWECGTTVTFNAIPFHYVSETWYWFERMRITYGCTEDPIEIDTTSRTATFALPDQCGGACNVKVEVWYQLPPYSGASDCEVCRDLFAGSQLLIGTITSDLAPDPACTCVNVPVGCLYPLDLPECPTFCECSQMAPAPPAQSGLSLQVFDGSCYFGGGSNGAKTPCCPSVYPCGSDEDYCDMRSQMQAAMWVEAEIATSGAVATYSVWGKARGRAYVRSGVAWAFPIDLCGFDVWARGSGGDFDETYWAGWHLIGTYDTTGFTTAERQELRCRKWVQWLQELSFNSPGDPNYYLHGCSGGGTMSDTCGFSLS